jgi:hypothetical protein
MSDLTFSSLVFELCAVVFALSLGVYYFYGFTHKHMGDIPRHRYDRMRQAAVNVACTCVLIAVAMMGVQISLMLSGMSGFTINSLLLGLCVVFFCLSIWVGNRFAFPWSKEEYNQYRIDLRLPKTWSPWQLEKYKRCEEIQTWARMIMGFSLLFGLVFVLALLIEVGKKILS